MPRQKDVHVLVIIPRIAAFLARGAEVELDLLFGNGVRIEVSGGEKDLIRAGPEERAGGFTNAGGNSRGLAGFEIQDIDLVKRISRLAFALEDERFAVG